MALIFSYSLVASFQGFLLSASSKIISYNISKSY